MSTACLGQAILDQLAAAQQVVDTHIVGCASCGINRLCFDRIEAERVFLQYGRLPRRTPGLTCARLSGRPGFGWFPQQSGSGMIIA